MTSEILVYNKTKSAVSKKLVYETILKALDLLKSKQPVEMAVLFVGDKEIRWLNKIWRRKDKTANVLSFPQLSKPELKRFKRSNVLSSDFGFKSRKPARPAGGSARFDFNKKNVLRLGEIVIDPMEISRSGAKTKKEFNRELAKLLIHGLLHLLGYGHQSLKEARRMIKIERKLSEKIIL